MPTTTIMVTPAQATAIRASLLTRRRELLDEHADPAEVAALDELLAGVGRVCAPEELHPITGQRGPLWSALYQLLYTRTGGLHDACLRYWRGRSSPADIDRAIAEVTAAFRLLRVLEEGGEVPSSST